MIVEHEVILWAKSAVDQGVEYRLWYDTERATDHEQYQQGVASDEQVEKAI